MNLLNNPLILNFIKGKLPELIDNLDEMESGLVSYINSFPLQENETHAVLFTEIDDNPVPSPSPEPVEGQKLYFCIGAFNKKTMVRLIDAKPAKEFIKQIINTALNKPNGNAS